MARGGRPCLRLHIGTCRQSVECDAVAVHGPQPRDTVAQLKTEQRGAGIQRLANTFQQSGRRRRHAWSEGHFHPDQFGAHTGDRFPALRAGRAKCLHLGALQPGQDFPIGGRQSGSIGPGAPREHRAQAAGPILFGCLEGLADQLGVVCFEVQPVTGLNQCRMDQFQPAFGPHPRGIVGRSIPPPTPRQPDRDAQIRQRVAQPPLGHPHAPAVVIDVPRRNPALRLRGEFHRAIEQCGGRRQVPLLQTQTPEAAVGDVERQVVQLAHAVGLQQGRLGQRQFATLEVLLTQAIAPVGVESDIARAVRGFDSLVEELPRLRHAILAGAKGGQLDQDLRQEATILRVQTVNRTLDPLGGRVEFTEFRIE